MLDRLETRVPPLLWLVITIGTVWLVSSFGDSWLPEGRGSVLGPVVVVFGVAIAAAGVVDFRVDDTSVDPMDLSKTESLVTTGVYRFTRNPMYLGMLCSVVGIGIWLESVVGTVVGAVLFVAVLTRLQIQPEERALAKQFGSAYTEYQKSVRRWI